MKKLKQLWKKNENSYIRILRFYIHRPVFYILLILTICISLLLFQKPLLMLWYNLNQGKSVPTFTYNASELAKYTGEVIILDAKGTKVYEGMFTDGACNGLGKYYESGELVYEGLFVNNERIDENAVEYKNGTPSYFGGYKSNRRFGNGIELHSVSQPSYVGEFSNGTYNGTGVQYDEKGNLLYEGEFVAGKRHGEGILYADGTNNRWRYTGTFAFDHPQGEGTFYDVYGKAYFNGTAYEGQINYTALIPCTLEDLEQKYLIPYEYVLVDGMTAIVYKNQKIAFVTQYPIEFVEDEDSKSLVLDEHIKKSDIILNRIIMADDDVDYPNPGNFTMEHVEKGWQKQYVPTRTIGIMDQEDILALYMSENKDFEKEIEAVQAVERGNGVKELHYQNSLDIRKRFVYKADKMNVIYGFPIYEDKLLYSVMRGIEIKDNDKEMSTK